MRILTNRFFRWGSRSLLGHIALFQVFFSLPLVVLSLSRSASQGPLSLRWALHTVLVAAAGGVVCAVLFWYTVMRPLITRQGHKK